MKRVLIGVGAALMAAAVVAVALPGGPGVTGVESARTPIPLKDAKLNIEYNATDDDTGFQGFIDSEGWQYLDAVGPEGKVLSFRGRGDLARLGLTELFFETVEPTSDELAMEDLLAMLPEGDYTIAGRSMENGHSGGRTEGTAWLTHVIPAGPELIAPGEGAVVPASGLVMHWGAVTETIEGDDVNIIAYQLIIERDAEPDPNMIGKFGLSMYLPPTTTSIEVPDGFLEPGTDYNWEVLAIEESGNQTLSSGAFSTED